MREGEEGSTRVLLPSSSNAWTKRQVRCCPSASRSVTPVGLVLPMIPEAAVSLLAIARIGAIAVPMFSGYRPAAIRERRPGSDAVTA